MSEQQETQQSEAEQATPRPSALLGCMLEALNPIFLKFEHRLEETPRLALELSILVDGERVHIGHGLFPADGHPLLTPEEGDPDKEACDGAGGCDSCTGDQKSEESQPEEPAQ